MTQGIVDAIEVREQSNLSIADDSLLQVAMRAEERIAAVVKIKNMALKVTSSGDWVDQNGKPYLQVSGSEKIANLFSVSWTIGEPTCEFEDSGHFTYTYKGRFSIPGRSIEVTGSRSSKDPFFKRYEYINNVKTEKPISAIDKRDVKMAAMTNLLGNGITRLLGIRNLTYADLEEFAGILKSQLGKVEYKTKPKSKTQQEQPDPQAKTKEQSSGYQEKTTYPPSGKKITTGQVGLIQARCAATGHKEEALKTIKDFYKVESTKDLLMDDMNTILDMIGAGQND